MSARSYLFLSIAAMGLLTADSAVRAEVYYTTNVMRHAITPIQSLERGATVQLMGTTDGDEAFSATLETNEAGAVTRLTVAQDGAPLGLPESAFADLSGADTAWLEERGALSTLVVEGWTAEGKRWRLALEFHPKQLWKRRFSLEGERRDLYTFYSRQDMTPSEPERRGAGGNGLYWRD
jgi:hypothetical protein